MMDDAFSSIILCYSVGYINACMSVVDLLFEHITSSFMNVLHYIFIYEGFTFMNALHYIHL